MSQVSCEPDVVHILDMSQPRSSRGQPATPRVTTTTTVIDNRALTIQTFKLEPGVSLESLAASSTRSAASGAPASAESALTPTKVKLEPGLLQTLPPEATPLKVEIQDNYLDSDIEGALIIADEENALNNLTLDYLINDNGTCTCKLCGEVTASRTHWYRHKYKVHNVCLFKCEKCEVYFKSKKGFEGHVANRHAPRLLGADGKLRSKKELDGLNKVLKEIQAKKEAEMVQKIIEKVKAECKAQGEDVDRRGYTKHYSNNS